MPTSKLNNTTIGMIRELSHRIWTERELQELLHYYERMYSRLGKNLTPAIREAIERSPLKWSVRIIRTISYMDKDVVDVDKMHDDIIHGNDSSLRSIYDYMDFYRKHYSRKVGFIPFAMRQALQEYAECEDEHRCYYDLEIHAQAVKIYGSATRGI